MTDDAASRGRPDDERRETDAGVLRGIAHDIRNALFGLSMNLELVLEDDHGGGAARRRAIQNVRQELDRIAELSDAISRVARARDARDGSPR